MAKVGSDADDDLYRGEWLRVRAMTLPNGKRPAKDWLAGLNDKGRGQFLSACEALQTSLRSGRPPAGRTEKVANSSEGLFELRVTKAGGSPPHLRAFFVRERQTLWVTHGFTKTSNKLKSSDIEHGESIARRWRKVQKG